MTVSSQGLVDEAVMLDLPARGAKRPWFRLQFSLASVFVLMTLCAVGTWYWYQRPFVVENKTAGLDPFAPPNAPAGSGLSRTVEYVRRVWGGKTVRHGPRREYGSAGNLLSSENYRNDQRDGEFLIFDAKGTKRSQIVFARNQRHGPFRQWDASGQLVFEAFYDHDARHGRYDSRYSNGNRIVEGQFDHNRPAGKWTWFLTAQDDAKKPRDGKTVGTITGQWAEGKASGRWEWRDLENKLLLAAEFEGGRIGQIEGADLNPRLLEALASGSIRNPERLARAFTFVRLRFEDDPLHGIVQYVAHTTPISIVTNLRGLEEAGISADARLSFECESAPLLLTFSDLLKSHNLGLDVRYDMIFVDTFDSIGHWKDTTGVLELVPPPGSRLAVELDKETNVDFVQQPLKDVVMYIGELHRLPIQLSLTPQPRQRVQIRPDVPVTKTLRGITLRNALGIVLSDLDCKVFVQGDTLVIEPQ